MDTKSDPWPHRVAPRQALDFVPTARWTIQRDDQLHPTISGNKWRKLKYFVLKALEDRHDTLLTFGGAFSNHLAATAAAGAQFGIRTIGIVRGEDADLNNPTLSFCRDHGMQLERVSRLEYNGKEDESYKDELHRRFGRTLVIPEGGAHYLGVNGCMEIVPREERNDWEHVVVPGGTGTTAAGILLSTGSETQVWLYSALKGGDFLRDHVRKLLYRFLWDEGAVEEELRRLNIVSDFHFGGYGKVDDELVDFLNEFYRKTDIPLDPIYTGKMMYGLSRAALVGKTSIETVHPPVRAKTLVVHTGGLQGIAGINARRKSLDRSLILFQG